MTSLEVLVDGTLMAEPEARAFWKRFSDHMEANRGDLAGFAKSEGYMSVHPAVGPAGPRLVVSRSAPQGPYRSVAKGGDDRAPGGSSGHQARRSASGGKSKKRRK